MTSRATVHFLWGTLLLVTSSFFALTQATYETCNYDFSGPSDVIFLVDRTQSFHESNLERIKTFIQDLARKTMKIGPDSTGGYSRLAVITFAGEANTDVDLISKARNIYTCELFAPGGIFDTDVPDTVQTDSSHEGIPNAILKAKPLLQLRPHVTNKVMFLASDFQTSMASKIKRDLSDLENTLNRNNVMLRTYGVGLGTYFNKTIMQIVFGSDPCKSKTLEQWNSFLGGMYVPYINMSRSVTNSTICCSLCDGSSSCSCYENDDLSSGLQDPICHESPGDTCGTSPASPPTMETGLTPGFTTSPEGPEDGSFDEYLWPLLLAIMCFTGSIILTVAVVAAVLHARDRRKRRERRLEENLDSMGKAPSRERKRNVCRKPKDMPGRRNNTSTNADDVTVRGIDVMDSERPPTEGAVNPSYRDPSNEDEDDYQNAIVGELFEAHGRNLAMTRHRETSDVADRRQDLHRQVGVHASNQRYDRDGYLEPKPLYGNVPDVAQFPSGANDGNYHQVREDDISPSVPDRPTTAPKPIVNTKLVGDLRRNFAKFYKKRLSQFRQNVADQLPHPSGNENL